MKNDTSITKQNQRFRISARKLFLTYSQVDPDCSTQHVIDQLQDNVDDIKDFVVGRELHHDGGTHFHAVLIAYKKFEIYAADKLDISFNGKTFHGNYKPVKLYRRAVEYACKSGDYITSLNNLRQGKLIHLEQELIEMYREKGINHTLDYYIANYTKEAFGAKGAVSVKRLFSVLDALEKTKKKQPQSPLSIEDFNLTPEIKGWMDIGCQTTGILIGPAGCGKTLFAKTLAKHLGLNMLIIKHREAMRYIAQEHDMLFFDDINLGDMDEEQLLGLLDGNDENHMRVLYGLVDKKAGLVQLMAFNPESVAKIAHLLVLPSFQRRIRVMPVDQNFIIKMNLNTHWHQHTHIHNNQEVMRRNLELIKPYCKLPRP